MDEAHKAAVALAKARWRGTVVSRAVATIKDRSGELTEVQRQELAAIARDGDGDE